jgi:hypothetical protein
MLDNMEMIHTLCAGMELHPDLDLDFINAYNDIFRLATARGLHSKLPSLLNYFETFYNDKAQLIFPDKVTSDNYKLLRTTMRFGRIALL